VDRGKKEDGFTLIELLVVILIIAILAAIAIPVFLAQREKGMASQVQTTLKNAATAAESWSTGHEGEFILLDGDDGTRLGEEGFKGTTGLIVEVAADVGEYCITVTHTTLPATNEWQIATYNSSDGSPSPSDVDSC
jgi:type IV pilus assembly protein PilA